jgi:hypothetical protein
LGFALLDLGLGFCFAFRVPSFMSSCGFGGALNIRRAISSVASSKSGLGTFAMVRPMEPFQLDFNPYSLPREILTAIGLVIAAAGQTEDTVDQLIAGCLGVDFEYGMSITLHMTMPQRFSAARSAAEIRLDDLDALDELDELLDRAEKAFDQRNSVVHHQWCFEASTSRVFIVKESARKRIESDVIEMNAGEVEDIASEIYDVGIQLFLFARKHRLIPTLPANPRPRHHKSRAARKKRREAMLGGS